VELALIQVGAVLRDAGFGDAATDSVCGVWRIGQGLKEGGEEVGVVNRRRRHFRSLILATPPHGVARRR
jgi:hypothetical protein